MATVKLRLHQRIEHTSMPRVHRGNQAADQRYLCMYRANNVATQKLQRPTTITTACNSNYRRTQCISPHVGAILNGTAVCAEIWKL